MSLQQKSKLPILERTNVCYSCNPQKETCSRRKENQFRAPDMHMPVIEINLHNITMYQKQRLFLYLRMFAKVNHVVNLKGKKADYKYPY